MSIKIGCPVCGTKVFGIRHHIRVWHPDPPIKRLSDEIHTWIGTDGNGMTIPNELLHLLANLDWATRD